MPAVLIFAAASVILGVWFAWRRTRRVPCELDLEATQAHFHAHARIEGVQVNEGDQVLLHDAPDHLDIGECRLVQTEATVTQVSLPRRLLVRVLGTAGITELYDVGFEG